MNFSTALVVRTWGSLASVAASCLSLLIICKPHNIHESCWPKHMFCEYVVWVSKSRFVHHALSTLQVLCKAIVKCSPRHPAVHSMLDILQLHTCVLAVMLSWLSNSPDQSVEGMHDDMYIVCMHARICVLHISHLLLVMHPWSRALSFLSPDLVMLRTFMPDRAAKRPCGSMFSSWHNHDCRCSSVVAFCKKWKKMTYVVTACHYNIHITATPSTLVDLLQPSKNTDDSLLKGCLRALWLDTAWCSCHCIIRSLVSIMRACIMSA